MDWILFIVRVCFDWLSSQEGFMGPPLERVGFGVHSSHLKAASNTPGSIISVSLGGVSPHCDRRKAPFLSFVVRNVPRILHIQSWSCC